jgi:two-component system response regulator HydG
VALHLHATPEGLLESELFGHTKGSFTGATTNRVGKLQAANGGTLFLDELGDMPLDTQSKLLRVLESRSFERVGCNDTIQTDVRLVAATNRDLRAMIAEGRFREELYYRLKVVQIELPPLRERVSDIPLLASHFLREFATRYDKPVTGFDPEALRALTRYPWPGNIRELKNVVETMVVLSRRETLALRDVPGEMRGGEGEMAQDFGGLAGRSLEEVEQELLRETLELTKGNRKEAAKILGIGERTLYRKIERYDLH